METFSMKLLSGAGLALFLALPLPLPAENSPNQILFTNVNVFDGNSHKLAEGVEVLVEGNLIKATGLEVNADNAQVIDGGGRTLMPGLHDMHTHIAIFRQVTESRNSLSLPYHGAVAAARLEGMLMNGFTTVMDAGGPAEFAQRLVDEGIFKGPRIYPSEALISQTSGHGDFRTGTELHPNLPGNRIHPWDSHFSCIADGATEIRRCVRQNLRRGASQVKIMAGGGISSQFDPVHSRQSSAEETRAAVEAAAAWDTFVAAHAFTDEAVQEAVENGVRYILHGPFITEKTAKTMADKGVYLGPTLAAVYATPWEVLETMLTPTSMRKLKPVYDTYPSAMKAAVKAGVTMVYGTDILAPPTQATAFDDKANSEFTYLARYMSNAEALKAATGNAGRLIQETGQNNPYPLGETGVIRPGAYADILLVDGDPLADISVMTNPDTNFDVIMKDGVIYKNAL